mmetsp:Transcript_58264/g.150035  ORF Transcript_58264/g.150035 Transcript_58264/m.150035 type:complete len:303 (+) Transcript_58264:390-1298(+)
MLKRDEILRVADRHRRRVVLEGVSVESQRVQDAPQHPDIHLLVDRIALTVVELNVCHLRRPVQHGHRLVDLFLKRHHFGFGQLDSRNFLRAARAKVAELPMAVRAMQHVLHLKVTVLDGRLQAVQELHRVGDLRERLQDLPRGEVAVLTVHEVEKVPSRAELKQELHRVAALSATRDQRPVAGNDVGVRRQHFQDLCLTLRRLKAARHLYALLARNLLQGVRLACPVFLDLHHGAERTLGQEGNLLNCPPLTVPRVVKLVHRTRREAAKIFSDLLLQGLGARFQQILGPLEGRRCQAAGPGH